MGLDHHGAVILVLRVGLEALGLLDSQRRPVDAVGAVDFLRDQLNALTQRHFEVVQELDVDRIFAGFDNGLCQLDRAFAAEAPVVGLGAADTVLLAELLQQRDLRVGIGVEAVDADDRVDAGLLDGVDMVEQVAGALFQKLEVLLGVLLGSRGARVTFGPPPCILSARTVATRTETFGVRPDRRVLTFQNFSKPMSAAKPDSVTW